MKKYSNLIELIKKHDLDTGYPKFDGVGYIYKNGKYFTKHGRDITEQVKAFVKKYDTKMEGIVERRGEIFPTPEECKKGIVSAAFTAGILNTKPGTDKGEEYANAKTQKLSHIYGYEKNEKGEETGHYADMDVTFPEMIPDVEFDIKVKGAKLNGIFPLDGICFNNGELAGKPSGPCQNAKIEAIEAKVGPKSGRTTYIAVLDDPVQLGDKKISRVNIYNNEAGGEAGDMVDVYLKNGIIAKLRRILVT